jgi:predicted phosphodiesterase
MSADELREALSTPPQPVLSRRDGPDVAKAGERPGDVTWDGTRGMLWTRPLISQPDSWDDILIEHGFDPTVVEVIEPFRFKAWDALGKADPETGVNPKVRMRWYGLVLRTRMPGASVAEIEKRISRRRARGKPAPSGPATFVLALGDLQLGKVDGDGYAGTFDRARDRIERAAVRLTQLRRIADVGPVHIAWLGDGCEGFVSQGGANTWRTSLTITEQMRLLRRLMMYSIDVFLPLTDELSIICVPGNHDQALRPGGKGSMTGSDSFDVEALVSLADAMKLNQAAYGHVTVHVPERDELTVTVETSRTIIGHAHGHKWNRGKHFDWWRGQRFGRQSIGEADVLLAGHLHHLLVEDEGPQRFIQVPSLESESTWYRHRTGSRGAPGVVTMLVADGKTHYLDVL